MTTMVRGTKCYISNPNEDALGDNLLLKASNMSNCYDAQQGLSTRLNDTLKHNDMHSTSEHLVKGRIHVVINILYNTVTHSITVACMHTLICTTCR